MSSRPAVRACLGEGQQGAGPDYTEEVNITKKTKTAPSETKSGIIRRLLSRKSGANLAALQDATGWQPHSVRAALSTLRKSGYKIDRTSAKADGKGAAYRITAVPARESS